jgi:anthranilate phosphoribosyltransferase
VRDGRIAGELKVDPGALGIPRALRSDLAGGDVGENARRLHAILLGEERSAAADAVALNAGAALVVAGVEVALPAALERCRVCLAKGAPAATLAAVVRKAQELVA